MKAHSPAIQLELARTVTESGGSVRLAMRGRSMLPLLHEPYVLHVSPLARPPRIGDIVVFRESGRHVVHRVVRLDDGRIRTSGDAQPDRFESVRPEDILGRVDSVWTGRAPQARRVDGPAFRLRGAYYARMYPVRRTVACAFDLLRRARAPWKRPRRFLLLYELLRSNAPVLPDGVVETAIQHRCAGFFMRDGAPAKIQRAVLGARLNTMALAREVEDVVRVLQEAAVPVVLLKGSARLRAGGERMRVHPSCDIDVLVPPELEDAAVEALQRHGYVQRADRKRQMRYRTHHHHAAPLYRQGCRPVEVHRALAPPSMFGTPTNWNALRPDLREETPGVYTLCAQAFALHSLMHAVLTFSLRDLVFLRECLQGMTDSERAQLWRRVREEPLDPVRLGGILALACDFAMLRCEAGALERLYHHWLLRRYDLPMYLQRRAQAVDAGFLLCSGRARQAWRIFSLEPHGLKFVGRFFTGCAALVYALLMRKTP